MDKYPSEIILSGRGKKRVIKSIVIQSPLAGVTDQVFRQLVRRWAPDSLLFTEMVNASSLGLGYGYKKINHISFETGPTGVQLFDHRPEALANAAKQAEDQGAFLIDINMGCPVKKIAHKGGGAALIKEPELAANIVNKVVNSVNIPVTVKTRLGWDRNLINPIKFSKLLQSAGAQLLTLHGRTREQGFSGKSDWETISEVKKSINIPLIANGDINTINDAINCLKTTSADGIMIGRGSLGAPWLVGQIDSALKGKEKIVTPDGITKINLALEQLKALLREKGDHGLLVARKHFNWTCKGFQGASELRYSLVRAKTPIEAIILLENKLNNLSRT